jgi:hypothetical protein
MPRIHDQHLGSDELLWCLSSGLVRMNIIESKFRLSLWADTYTATELVLVGVKMGSVVDVWLDIVH